VVWIKGGGLINMGWYKAHLFLLVSLDDFSSSIYQFAKSATFDAAYVA
jgi:hypothetical protein